jgi:hypothetical protein
MDHRRSLILGAALTGAALLFWRGREPARESIVVHATPAPEPLDQPITVAVSPAPPSYRLEPQPPAAPSSGSANEDLIAGPGDENHVPGAKPHPITPEHIRLHEEISLFKAASDAVAARDVPEIRRIVEEHRASYPDQNQDMADGYEILADCIAYPGAASTARARRFFEEETYSTMRRPILRTCLEGR